MTPICSPRATACLLLCSFCNEKVFVVSERRVNCQENYKLSGLKKKVRCCIGSYKDRVSEKNVFCFSSQTTQYIAVGGGGYGLGQFHASSLHPVLNHQMARYYLCQSPSRPPHCCLLLTPPILLGNAPPLGDGWLQLSTNNHGRTIWLHSFCLRWCSKMVIWK